MKRTSVVLAFFLAVTACEGPVGPVGPGTRRVFNAVTDQNGEAFVELPPEAGTLTSLPTITCYVSADGIGWFVLAYDTDSTSLYSACIIEQVTAGNLVVTVLAGPDLLVRVVVVY